MAWARQIAARWAPLKRDRNRKSNTPVPLDEPLCASYDLVTSPTPLAFFWFVDNEIMSSPLRHRVFVTRRSCLAGWLLCAAAIQLLIDEARGQDEQPALVVRVVPIEVGNRVSSFGGDPVRFAKTSVARAARIANVPIAPPAHQALAHGYNNRRLFYLFYNEVINVPENRYLVQRIRRTKTNYDADGKVVSTETEYQVEAFKSLNGRIKRPDQHFGSYALGTAHRRVITKEFEVGVADVAHLAPAKDDRADETDTAGTEATKTGWPFEERVLFHLIQRYGKDPQRYDELDYSSSVKWNLEVCFDRHGNYGVSCPELGIDVTQRVPELVASSSEWAKPVVKTEAGAPAPQPTDDLTLHEGKGIAGLQIGVSTLRDAVRVFGNPLSQKQMNASRNVVFKQHVSLTFGPSGQLHTVSTLAGFSGATTRGIRHDDSSKKVVSRYGPPVQQTKQTISYPDIIFWKNQDGNVSKMVAWQRPNPLQWSRLPDHPNPYGVAGPIVGVHDNVLITAGGANFPDGLPWHPTKTGGVSLKKYWANIHVLSDSRVGAAWRSAGDLTAPVGYSISISTTNGVLSIGGERSEIQTNGETSLTRLNTVQRLAWHRASKTVHVSNDWTVGDARVEFPKLPVGTTAACGAIVGPHIYLAGGDSGEGGSSQFLRLTLAPQEGVPWKWESLATWPGPPRSHAIGLGQGGKFFLISGRNKLADRDFEILSDAYVFDPQEHKSGNAGWRKIADVSVASTPTSVMAGTGVATPNGKLMIIGGASGEVLLKKEVEIPRLIAEAKAAGDNELVARLEQQATELYDFHKGFSRNVLSYDVQRNVWRKTGEMPVTGPVTTTAVLWNNRIVIPSGERAPGVRTRSVWQLSP